MVSKTLRVLSTNPLPAQNTNRQVFKQALLPESVETNSKQMNIDDKIRTHPKNKIMWWDNEEFKGLISFMDANGFVDGVEQAKNGYTGYMGRLHVNLSRMEA